MKKRSTKLSMRCVGPVALSWSGLLLLAATAFAQGDQGRFFRAHGPKVDGQYVVVFRDDLPAAQAVQETAAMHRARAGRVWEHALNGAVLSGLTEEQARALSHDPRVRWVEEDAIVNLSATPWGLDRIDQRNLPLDDDYQHPYSGAGVTVYVIDTGILLSHQEFGGRASWGANLIDVEDTDCHGHGTHVAGIVGGATYGVAKAVDLVAVKVVRCNGSGNLSHFLSGVDWVTANAVQPAVVNMSLGVWHSPSLSEAVDNSVAAGTFYAVAAGNDNADACNFAPVGAAGSYAVGSTTSSDQRSGFSNWGPCVDVFAPGSAITSAWLTSDTATKTLSGTSFASPHVAGVAALVREEFPSFTVDGIRDEISAWATSGVVTDPMGAPNLLLLYSLNDGTRHSLTISMPGTGRGVVTSTPTGVDCSSDCVGRFQENTIVTLEATPDPFSEFAGWSGAGCSGNAFCVVTMDGAKAVTATLDEVTPSHVLTMTPGMNGTVTSSPTGIDCGADCAERYAEGALVTLTATPSSGYLFSNWSGAGCSTMNPCDVTVNGAETVAVSFVTSFDLAVAKSGTGSGTVTSAPGGIDCGVDCTEPFAEGSAVTLTAAPAPASGFVGWTGAGCAGTGDCVVTMDAAQSVTAIFDDAGTLRLTLVGLGSGVVTISPAGIDCVLGFGASEAECVEPFAVDTVVTLTATPDPGSKFDGWSGAGCSGTDPCIVTLDTAKGVTATFGYELAFELSVTLDGTGSGVVTSSPDALECALACTVLFSNGTVVILTASPDLGSQFIGWDGEGCSGLGTCEVTMVAARSVQATFDTLSHDLTVTIDGSGTGAVTSSPAGIDCGVICSAPFGEGSTVTLTAASGLGSTFSGWTGAGCSPTGTCIVTMDAGRSITANFSGPGFHDLTVTLAGAGSGVVTSSPAGIDCGVDCIGSYPEGSVVTLTATPNAGAAFDGWSGAGCSGAGSCVVTMDEVATVTATFSPAGLQILTVVLTGNGGGVVTSSPPGLTCGDRLRTTCEASFASGTVVTLTTLADAGSVFRGWDGSGCSGTSPCSVTMDVPRSVTATVDPVEIFQDDFELGDTSQWSSVVSPAP